MTAVLALALIDALLRPLLLVTLTACVLVIAAVARDTLAATYADDLADCACGPGAHHPSCPTRPKGARIQVSTISRPAEIVTHERDIVPTLMHMWGYTTQED